jgi:hypothetical protein
LQLAYRYDAAFLKDIYAFDEAVFINVIVTHGTMAPILAFCSRIFLPLKGQGKVSVVNDQCQIECAK